MQQESSQAISEYNENVHVDENVQNIEGGRYWMHREIHKMLLQHVVPVAYSCETPLDTWHARLKITLSPTHDEDDTGTKNGPTGGRWHDGKSSASAVQPTERGLIIFSLEIIWYQRSLWQNELLGTDIARYLSSVHAANWLEDGLTLRNLGG